MNDTNEWKDALQHLTPTGSEFLTPKECADWLRGRLNYPQRVIRLEAENARLRDRSALLDDVMQAVDDTAGRGGIWKPLWKRYQPAPVTDGDEKG
jgi:hypothetical protein